MGTTGRVVGAATGVRRADEGAVAREKDGVGEDVHAAAEHGADAVQGAAERGTAGVPLVVGRPRVDAALARAPADCLHAPRTLQAGRHTQDRRVWQPAT